MGGGGGVGGWCGGPGKGLGLEPTYALKRKRRLLKASSKELQKKTTRCEKKS